MQVLYKITTKMKFDYFIYVANPLKRDFSISALLRVSAFANKVSS